MQRNKTLYHVVLFILGFVYYLLLPPIIGLNNYLSDYPGMSTFLSYFPEKEDLIRYFILSGLILVFFLLGSYLPLKYKRTEKFSIYDVQIPPYNKYILLLLVLVNQYIIISNRGLLFTGYTQDYNIGFLGQLATLNSIYLFFFLLYRTKFLTFLVVENSIVLLGLGSRMFVLIPIVSYIVYLLDNKKLKTKSLILVSFLTIIMLLAVGVLRGGGDSVVNMETMLYIGLAEPLFTWISAASFITSNPEIDVISFPINFIGHFLNFVPSVIFPNKAAFIQDIPYLYDTPFGASSLVLNLYGNFGLILTPIVAFVGGLLLTIVRYSKGLFAQVYYYCCCGMIPFLLFRDLQSFNKLLFMSFLIYPFIVIYVRLYTKKKSNE